MHLFEDNPLAIDFILTNNTTSEHFNLTKGSVNIPPGASGRLQDFWVSFCDLKYRYVYMPLVREWFDSGKITATPVLGTEPLVCPWEPQLEGGTTVKVDGSDSQAGYLFDKVETEAPLTKAVVDVGGEKKLQLSAEWRDERSFTDLDIWPVLHNYGYEPVVQVVDLYNRPRWFVDIVHQDENRFEVRWGSPQSGKVKIR